MKIAWFPRDRDALDDVVECDPLTAITEHFFVYFWHDVSPLIAEKPRLKIGRYCSIGLECEFMLGGNHRHDWASQFAFPAFMPECKAENYLKAKVTSWLVTMSGWDSGPRFSPVSRSGMAP